MGDFVATEALGLAATDGVAIILDEATVLIVESSLDRVLLVVQVRNEKSIEISLPLDRVKYGCSASGYFGEAALTQCIYFSLNLIEVDSKRRICKIWGVQVDSMEQNSCEENEEKELVIDQEEG
uniref:Uncharacterized protein n=1 Tax=Solanum tuberosum TaxID=4113 RepID=M1B3T1_SOLTU